MKQFKVNRKNTSGPVFYKGKEIGSIDAEGNVTINNEITEKEILDSMNSTIGISSRGKYKVKHNKRHKWFWVIMLVITIAVVIICNLIITVNN